jgi:phosphate-selective porin OprO/OprP
MPLEGRGDVAGIRVDGGEQVTRSVNMVQPRREFNFNFLKPGERFSPGAIEVFGRYSTMDIGRNIFTAGFADPNLWTNHVWATEFGLNWYLNFYTRVYLDW